MRRHLALTASSALMLTLLGCITPDCSYSVKVGSPNTQVTYTDSQGTVYEGTTDADGNIAVPCGSQDTIEQVRIAFEQSLV